MVDIPAHLKKVESAAEAFRAVRRHLHEVDLDLEFERLVRAWDECSDQGDFTDFSRRLVVFLRLLIARLATYRECDVEPMPLSRTRELELLKVIVRGSLDDDKLLEKGVYVEDACLEIAGNLEALRKYEDPANLLRDRSLNVSEWAREHYDSEEFEGYEPIDFQDILNALDDFLGSIKETKAEVCSAV